ncbi:hypothetical protein [[Phormidium] sp. ETS-05]|uniref:hypothetical protein n=1 Tax=[Phormidium] sp. ETS-05 TaxID=222819 RepID=UPI0018EEE211|nr:hypothetical protein [[Phormidium] sp. ETS-05]
MLTKPKTYYNITIGEFMAGIWSNAMIKVNRGQLSKRQKLSERIAHWQPVLVGAKIVKATMNLCREFYTARSILLADSQAHHHQVKPS